MCTPKSDEAATQLQLKWMDERMDGPFKYICQSFSNEVKYFVDATSAAD